MIVNADTIVNPWTVMIHFENASITVGAMMRPLRFPSHVALLARIQSSGINIVGN